MRLLMFTLVLSAAPAWCLLLDASNIGISRMIPRQGETVTWAVPLLNDSDQPFEGEVTATLRWARRGARLEEPVALTRTLSLQPGEAQDLVFSWTPPANGYYRVLFEVPARDLRVERQVAVTADDLIFLWFGAPRRFRWCNVPTTVEDKDEAWWLRRGAIPAHWKCGVCCRERSVEDFVQIWGAADWIAIDEVGGPGEDTDKFIAAWKRLKQDKPHQWIAVWFMGAHLYWRDIKDLVDLFVPEIYLNYRGNHLGQFDAYLRVAREAGVIRQVIPGLGINEIKDDRGRVTCSPTRADVLRQFRYLKRTAPDLRGIGFFTSDSAAYGVAEYADDLCEEYFVKPVITILNLAHPITLSGHPADATRTATVRMRNVGGMDAENVRLEWVVGHPQERAQLSQVTVPFWPAGEEKEFQLEVSRPPGAGPLQVRILPDPDYTVLDGVATTWIVRPPPGREAATVASAPAGTPDPAVVPLFVDVTGSGPYQISELAAGLRRTLDIPCAVLPPRPGMDETLAVLPAPPSPDTPRFLLLEPGGAARGAAPRFTQEGTMLTVTTDFYVASLDLSRDQIVSLAPAGVSGNILRGPWNLDVVGHEGFGPAQVQELPGCLAVTVPFSSDTASGASQYLFFSYSSAIRVARSWVPKGEVVLEGASEGCALFQQGGTFALQPGVGGVVTRGRLHDSDEYRDLYFGYLGDVPRPDNADRVGWLDFSYGATDAGLGVALEYRWVDADTSSYDVTRLYDASDWLQVCYLWGKRGTFGRAQRSCLYLIPHRRLDFTDEAIEPPAQALWRRLHADALAAIGQ